MRAKRSCEEAHQSLGRGAFSPADSIAPYALVSPILRHTPVVQSEAWMILHVPYCWECFPHSFLICLRHKFTLRPTSQIVAEVCKRCGGIFVSRDAAVKYAVSEWGFDPQTIRWSNEPLSSWI